MNTTPSKTQQLIVSIGALSVSCIALVVMTGWLTRDSTLTQIHAEWAPMQFNAALCFLLGSIAIHMESRSSRPPTLLLGSIVLTVGALTVLQYALAFNFGLDELFVRAHFHTKTSHPGRMAPGTAFCFTALGIYLVACVHLTQHLARLGRLLAGAILFSFGIIALIGYALGIEQAYAWEEYTRMSVLTASALTILGTALLASRWSRDRAYKAVLVVTLAGTVLSLAALHLNRGAELLAFRARLSLDSSLPVWILQKDAGMALRYLQSAGAFIESSQEITAEEFERFIGKVAGDVLSVAQYEWVPLVSQENRKTFEDDISSESGGTYMIHEKNPDGSLRVAADRPSYYPVKYMVPAQRHSSRLGLDLSSEPGSFATIRSALERGRLTVSSPIISHTQARAGQRRIYYAAYPVRAPQGGGYIGIVGGIVDTQGFLDRSLAGLPDTGLDLFIFDTTEDPDGILIAQSISKGHRGHFETRPYRLRSQPLPSTSALQTLPIAGRTYTVLCVPTERYMLQFTALPWIALIVSYGMTVSTAFFIYWLTDRSDHLKRAKRFLEIQTGVGRLLQEENSLGDIARGVLQILCRNSPWSVGGFWLVGPSGLLYCSAFWISPGHQYRRFESASLSPDCRHDQSLIGRIWKSGHHEWIPDISKTPDSLRREAAVADGISSGIGFPIHIRNRVVGVIDLYSRAHQEPDLELLHVLAAAGTAIGQYLLRLEAVSRLEEQRQDLERVNLELDSFVYTASHDLRAPLRAIGSFADFLEQDHGPKLDAQGRDYLSEIKKGVRRMAALIDDLLTLSRLSRIHNPYENVEMTSLAKEVLDRLGFDIDSSGVEVVVHDPLPTIRCDRIKMGELLINLIGNAVKYSSKLSGRRGRVEIGYLDRDAEHVLYVRDNGIGIEPKYHEQIFGMFKRLHTQEEYEGTGAGLSIVKRIVEEHRGRVWLESSPGKGSTFFFSIPKNIIERPGPENRS
ncbi:MAG: Adaptive-response sensory-kinase SasA [Candidatus Omnitrophica bacterium]|nr:Adaptive-response sensory-kinase SasA [Candidatus Omnitrophota bacterium]